MNDGRAWLRLAYGLLLTPALVTLALRVLPQLPTTDAVASFVSFAGATSVAIAALALASTAAPTGRVTLGVAALAALTLGGVAAARLASGAAVVAVDTALVGLAWALGASLGRRVQHPAHLLPACVVAASADVVSLLSPEGPSHAIASNDRALSVLAIWFPVPGSHAIAPALGVGDLLFMAFVLGVASAHHLDYRRAVMCCVLGTAVAGFAAACLGVAFPALVPIAAVTVIGLPGIRQLRNADRRAAHVSMLIAASVAVATVARSAVSP
jgi:hypothetical protein